MVVDPPQLVQTLDTDNKPVESRIADGSAARALVNRLIIEDGPRSRMRALVKGLIDGNPPYSDAKRRQNKLEWTANINFMQGQAMMDSTAVPFYAIFNGVENYADCRTAFRQDDPNHEYWCDRISMRFHQMLRRWKQFDWHIQQISYWMRLHGIGPIFWEKDGDWRFRSMESGNLLAPQEAPSVVDSRLPFVVLRVRYRVHELFDKIRDEKAAEALGWNVEYVKNAIKYAARGIAPNAQWWSSPWEFWQHRLKNNDLYASFTGADMVYCSYVFAQELNGKVSKMLVTEGGLPAAFDSAKGASYDPKKHDKQFLFNQPNQYDNFSQCIQAFFLNANDGMWHSVRGYGTAGFKYFELSNRLLCRASDGVFMKGSLVLQPGTSKNSDKLQLTQHGPVTWLPAGAELKQIQMQGATDELLAFHRVLNNQFSSNMGVNTGQPLSRTDGRGEVPTAEQIRAQDDRDASISMGTQTLFFLQLDGCYEQTYERASDPNTSDDEAKRFQRECIQDGVPREALTDMEYVRANRTSGYGSPAQRRQSDREMLEIMPKLPEEGQQNALEDIVTGIKGADKMRRYVPKLRVPGNDEWMASVENDMMEEQREPILTSGQDDVIHLNSHLQDAANKLAPAQQQMENGQQGDAAELQKLYGYVQILSEHCEAHLARLQRDPSRKPLVATFQEQLAHLVSFSGKLRGAYIQTVKAQQLAQSQQNEATTMNALDQARLQSQHVDDLLKASKTSAAIKDKNAKTVNDMRIAAIKAGQDVAIKAGKHSQDMAHAEDDHNADTIAA